MAFGCNFCAVQKTYTDPEPRLREKKTVFDHVFSVLCLINGLQVFGEQTRFQSALLKLLWFSGLIFHVTVLSKRAFDSLVDDEEDELSLTEVVRQINTIGFTLISFYAAFAFITKRDLIVSFLKSGNRRVKDFVLPLFATLPHIVMRTFLYDGNWGFAQTIRQVRSVHVQVMKLGFLLVYSDILGNIHAMLEDISGCAQKLQFGGIAAKKWNVRDRIRNVNDVLAWVLSGYYVVLPDAIVFRFVTSLGKQTSLENTYVNILALMSIVIQLCFFAKKSSACISLSRRTDDLVSRLGDTSDVFCEQCQRMYRELLLYREERDSLKVGCFTHSIPNLVCYAVTCATSVAVLLQFDFNMVRAFGKLI